MRIAELSARSGVPIPTIKYYIRERLLPAGERASAPNQAYYGEEHLRRLRSVRALIDLGGQTVSGTRTLLELVGRPEQTTHGALGALQYAVTDHPEHRDDQAHARAAERVARLAARLGWPIDTPNPARQSLTEVIATLYRLEQDRFVDLLDDYADAALSVAELEVDAVDDDEDRDALTESAVTGIVLGDVLLLALRRLAQEHASRKRFGPAEPIAQGER